ncbi:GroES-like protein [Coemansia reversa NRRL 1564]|uniref:GroES-like protein n=1 Tax=Coemansia reversa (strain ATCC 12441 / NRRL 1564) TaxID=763665 RepID=A0A2G5B938_COERN|nr:GroES-like protein [Coemansia reversa NRRL 1564]|eukprot:PIA15529.1 GroES-like protein [Coemansia reversa NRRL 1564]
MASYTYRVAYVDHYTSNPADIIIGSLPGPKDIPETQVLIEVYAAALNPIDYKRAEGMVSLMYPEAFPLRLGYDVAGVVTKAGIRAERFKEGDKVYGRLSYNHAGSIGEVVVAEESVLAHIPESVSFTVAAAVPLAGMTAKQALEWAGLERGQSLFVNGGMGGVGMFAVALAKNYFGAKEITTTVSTGKIDLVKQMGATKVVDYQKESYTEVLENTADVVFDTVGDAEIYRVAKHNSSAVSVVLLPDGNALDQFRHESAPLSLFGKAKLAAAKLIVAGAGWYLTRGFRSKNIRYGYVVMSPDGRDLEKTFNPLLENKTIKPTIANVYPFTTDGVQSAFKELMAGHVAGKIIIRVKD